MKIRKQHFLTNPKSKLRTHTDRRGITREKSNIVSTALLDSPRPSKVKLVSSAHGKIKRILLTIPDSATFESNVSTEATGLKSLIRELGNDVKLTIFTHEKVEGLIIQWLKEVAHTNFEIVLAEDDLDFTIWAEDAFATGVSGENQQTYLLEPISFPRFADAVIADYVASETDLKNFQVPAYFEGGNILIGDDFYLIGLDYAYATAYGEYIRTVPPNMSNFIEIARTIFKTFLDGYKELIFPYHSFKTLPEKSFEIIELENEIALEIRGEGYGMFQPIFHIDMFISLLGRNRNTGKYKLMVGDPQLAIDLIKDLDVLIPSSYTLNKQFNQVAKNLEKEGFEVYRNPMPYIFLDKNDELGYTREKINNIVPPEEAERIINEMRTRGLERINVREWYFATYNNNITEILPESKTVYLPTYGHGVWPELAQIDEENKRIWHEEHKFNVKLLDDFHPLANLSGAVHCISKYIERE